MTQTVLDTPKSATLCWACTYVLGWDLDTNLLDGLRELIWLDGTILIEVEVLEGLLENLLLRLSSLGLLRQLVLEFSLETTIGYQHKINNLK